MTRAQIHHATERHLSLLLSLEERCFDADSLHDADGIGYLLRTCVALVLADGGAIVGAGFAFTDTRAKSRAWHVHSVEVDPDHRRRGHARRLLRRLVELAPEDAATVTAMGATDAAVALLWSEGFELLGENRYARARTANAFSESSSLGAPRVLSGPRDRA